MRKIYKYLLTFCICFFCSFSRASETDSVDLSVIHYELLAIQENLSSLLFQGRDIFYELQAQNYEILEPLLQSLDAELRSTLPEIKQYLNEISTSVGYSLGSDVFEIYGKVSNIDGNVYETYSKVSSLLDEVINIEYRLEELIGLSSYVQNIISYLEIQYENDEQTNDYLKDILYYVKNINILIDQNEVISEMAEDIFQIRNIIELNIETLMNHIDFIANRQELLYQSFTFPFSKSSVPSYSFPFWYFSFTSNPSNNSTQVELKSFDVSGGESSYGILQDIGDLLVNMLEGDSNASFMLATICKNVQFNKINEEQQKDEYFKQIEDPISTAKTQFDELWSVGDNGELIIWDKYYTPIPQPQTFKEQFLSLFTEYQQVLRRYDINQLPEGKMQLFKYTFGDFQVDSFELELPMEKFSFVFESIRIIFGVVYYIFFFSLLFFAIRWSIFAWNFICKLTSNL